MINKELVEKKYQEMKGLNKAEDFLDEKSFGDVKIFINIEPKMILFKISIDPDIIYVGSN